MCVVVGVLFCKCCAWSGGAFLKDPWCGRRCFKIEPVQMIGMEWVQWDIVVSVWSVVLNAYELIQMFSTERMQCWSTYDGVCEY